MTPYRNEGRTPWEKAIFKAHLARHESRLADAMTLHERAIAAAERRIADSMRAHERALEAAERRMNRTMRGAEPGVDRMELIRAIKGRRKPPPAPGAATWRAGRAYRPSRSPGRIRSPEPPRLRSTDRPSPAVANLPR